jgi:hypothetical protein
MREVAKGTLKPVDAVRAYHGALHTEGVQPVRSLDDDLQVTEPALMLDRSPELVPSA